MTKWIRDLEHKLNADRDACQYTLRDLIKKHGARHKYINNVTGDACVGDKVLFARATFSGSYRKPKFDGYEVIQGTIIRDSYGAAKQQHTFTIQLKNKKTMRIKGRNLYSVAVFAKDRDDEERKQVLEDKHERGQDARAARNDRIADSRWDWGSRQEYY